MIIEGYAEALYPNTDRSNPSPFVLVRITKPTNRVNAFPVYVQGEQWNTVIVPILQETTFRWRGKVGLGDLVSLMNDIVGPSGTTVYPTGTQIGRESISSDSVGTLFPQDATLSYLDSISKIILRDATAAGY